MSDGASAGSPAGACSFADREGEPCWGDVELVREADTFDGRLWIQACRGHAPIAFGGVYAARDGKVSKAVGDP